MLDKFSLKQRFAVLIAAVALGNLVLGGWFYKTLAEMKVSGPIYTKIVLGKDLVADILPPPEYILESYLVTLQLARAQPEEVNALADRLKVLHNDYNTRHEFWLQQTLDGNIKQTLTETAHAPAARFYELAETRFTPAALSGNHEAMSDALKPMSAAYEEHRKAIDTVVRLTNENNAQIEAAAAATLTRANWGMLAVFALALGIVIAIAMLVANSIMRRLGGEPDYAANIAARIAKGDLSGNIQVSGQNNDSLVASLGTMQNQLRSMMTALRDSSQKLFQSSGELATTMSTLSNSGKEQADSATGMAASMEEMTVSISHISDRAHEAHQMSADAGNKSSASGQVVQQSADEMRRISESVTDAAQKISALESAATEISTIVKVIREIADQTNLLALNAAIEAARAGEQGRGFAVVADEVRKLAERTGHSTHEIGTMVERIQGITREAVSGMSANVAQVNQSAGLAHQTGLSINDIQEASQRVLSAVNDMASALSQQTSASQDIARNIEHIAQMTESSSAAMAQASSLAGTLEQSASELDQMVGRFKL
ncbi:MAG: methyl-accepting chemotaxis protein [Gallionellaceae bacterium]|jgi:methyl-accepting chemotaxis protein